MPARLVATSCVDSSAIVVTQASPVLDNSLWNELRSLLVGLTSLATPPLTANPVGQADIQQVLVQLPSQTSAAVTAYRPQLSDFFLGGVMLRHGGPSVLDQPRRGRA
jgi:hypothetical protein